MTRSLVRTMAEEVSKQNQRISAPCRCSLHWIRLRLRRGIVSIAAAHICYLETDQISNSTPISIILSWGILK
jgi:hypothetical protein